MGFHTEILMAEITVLIPAPFLEMAFSLCELQPVLLLSRLLHTNAFMKEIAIAPCKELALPASDTLWDLMNDEAVCRTAPASPGLLKSVSEIDCKSQVIERRRLQPHFEQHRTDRDRSTTLLFIQSDWTVNSP